MLNLNDWTTSSGKFPERAKSPELTEDVKNNAKDLVFRISALLIDLGEDPSSKKFSSGFRPSIVNANTPNSAKKSGHLNGKAGDLEDDKDQTLALKILARPDLLKKHKLMIENPKSTKGKNTNWVHLDTIPRVLRASYMFSV